MGAFPDLLFKEISFSYLTALNFLMLSLLTSYLTSEDLTPSAFKLRIQKKKEAQRICEEGASNG